MVWFMHTVGRFGISRRPVCRVLYGRVVLQSWKAQSVCFSTASQNREQVKKPSKLQALWKKYRILAPVTYLSMYAVTLGSVFGALEFDVFNAATFGFDPTAGIQKLCDAFEYVTGSSKMPEYVRENPTVGTFLLAWLMTKVTEPVRLAITVAIVPKVAQLWDARKDSESKDE